MSNVEKNMVVNDASRLAKWFEVSITIKIFGKVIWSYSYPPQKNSEND